MQQQHIKTNAGLRPINYTYPDYNMEFPTTCDLHKAIGFHLILKNNELPDRRKMHRLSCHPDTHGRRPSILTIVD